MDTEDIAKKLDAMIELQQNLLALELSRSGVPMTEIAKRLHIAKAKVVVMLRGVNRSE